MSNLRNLMDSLEAIEENEDEVHEEQVENDTLEEGYSIHNDYDASAAMRDFYNEFLDPRMENNVDNLEGELRFHIDDGDERIFHAFEYVGTFVRD